MKSVFTPVDKQTYQILFSFKHNENEIKDYIPETPSPFQSLLIECEENKERNIFNNQMKQPKRVNALKKTKNSKRMWTNEEKSYAIQKALQIGIAKALRILQNEYSLIYSDLAPSTLQYWVARSKKD